jgi:hypothetical protein
MPVDFSATVLLAGENAFGEQAQFLPAAGGVIVTSDSMWEGFGLVPATANLGRGVFDEGNRDLVFQGTDEVPTTTEIPTLGIRLAEFVTAPLQDDKVVLRGTTYVVMEVLIDSHGNARLKLQATT